MPSALAVARFLRIVPVILARYRKPMRPSQNGGCGFRRAVAKHEFTLVADRCRQRCQRMAHCGIIRRLIGVKGQIGDNYPRAQRQT